VAFYFRGDDNFRPTILGADSGVGNFLLTLDIDTALDYDQNINRSGDKLTLD